MKLKMLLFFQPRLRSSNKDMVTQFFLRLESLTSFHQDFSLVPYFVATVIGCVVSFMTSNQNHPTCKLEIRCYRLKPASHVPSLARCFLTANSPRWWFVIHVHFHLVFLSCSAVHRLRALSAKHQLYLKRKLKSETECKSSYQRQLEPIICLSLAKHELHSLHFTTVTVSTIVTTTDKSCALYEHFTINFYKIT